MSLLDTQPLRQAAITLVLAGPPRTRHEPKHLGQGRSFPDKRTARGIEAWRLRWEQAGCPRIDGPVALLVTLEYTRPTSHLTTKGAINATGRRMPVPVAHDCSNVAKLVEDALKHHAFGDDALIADLHVTKGWSRAERTTVIISPWLG